jgi:hypothetical protein
MPRQRPFIDPRMIARLEPFFSQRCTIEAPVKTPDSFGSISETFTTVTGWEAIPCRVAPVGGGEQRTNQQVYVDATHTIELMGIFNGISEEMQAIVNSVHYDIVLVEVTPEATITRLQARIIR